jgi:hypothetical protein
MDPIAIMALFFGAIICFFGYPMIHSAIRVWGFLIGGIFGLIIALAVFKIPGGLNNLTTPMGIAFGVGGIVGTLIAGPLSAVIIFLTGTALGWGVGYYVPMIVHWPENFLLAVSLALVTGLLSIRFQEEVLILSTAFAGAVMFIYGAVSLMRLEMLWLAVIFFLALFFGAAAQYKSIHPESSLMKF